MSQLNFVRVILKKAPDFGWKSNLGVATLKSFLRSSDTTSEKKAKWGSTMSEQDGLLRDFLVETKDGLDHLDEELLALEANPNDRDLINSIFRRVHTIKGVCGFLGLGKLEAVTHAGETLLGEVRSEVIDVGNNVVSLLLTLCDAIRSIVCSLEEHKSEGDGDFSQLIDQLLKAAVPSVVIEAKQELSLDEEFERLLIQREAEEASAAAAQVVQPVASAAVPPANDAAKNTAEVHETTPGRNGGAESSLRVDVALLDHLMNLAGELVLARNQIIQTTKSMPDSTIRAVTQRLDLVTTELQEGVMKTRMQPINTVWSKFPRVVRDLAIACKKQVRLEMFGKETELDKTLIEAIKDPLTHIVRNSIDHGIEEPARRRELGKGEEGCITMRAGQEGGYVIIEIIDDGAGLNTAKIKDRALQRGLISRDRAEAMSDADVNRLIFAPGFSTADTVTNLSGRGVGMDVVKSSVEKIGGHVDISSQPGQGSSIRLKIPLTLAIIPALLLSCADQKFAVPQSAITELVQLGSGANSGALTWIGSYPFFKLRGDLLPVLFLEQQLGVTAEPCSDLENRVVVILDVDGGRFGVVVDTVWDTEEIVVKPLGRQLSGLSIYAGATILGDGQIALILDPVVLSREAHIDNIEEEQASDLVAKQGARTSQVEQLLVVEVSQNLRAGIPVDWVRRLEEFSPKAIERVANSCVVQYRGSILPVVDVGSAILKDCELAFSGNVVVVGSGDALAGLGVRAIIDVTDQVLIEKPVHDKPGITAFGIFEGQVIAILDVKYLVSRCEMELVDAREVGVA